jgi:hypothetical protein
VVRKIPIFGTLLLIGGLGFSTLEIVKNNVTNFEQKLNQFGKLAL